MDLSKKLAMFASNNISGLENPFDDNNPVEIEEESNVDDSNDDEEITMESLSIDWYLNKSKEKKKKDKKKKKKDLFEDLLEIDEIDVMKGSKKSLSEKLEEDMTELSESELIELGEDFDDYISNGFESDENTELRNSLISLGRKYARDTASSQEMSEIAKAYSGSEKKLHALYDELNKDKNNIQKDIDQMRLARSKNFKSLAELISTKNSFVQSQLSIVKELNAMQKHQFDLKYKDAKNNPQVDEGGDISTNAIKSLFGLGRKEMFDSMGGFSEISGGNIDGEDMEYESDEALVAKYIGDEEETDGDKFLRYENIHTQYIALVDSDGKVVDVIVEDEETGDLIPDYPLPSNIHELNFSIDTSTMSAEDDLHRRYKVRYI